MSDGCSARKSRACRFKSRWSATWTGPADFGRFRRLCPSCARCAHGTVWAGFVGDLSCASGAMVAARTAVGAVWCVSASLACCGLWLVGDWVREELLLGLARETYFWGLCFVPALLACNSWADWRGRSTGFASGRRRSPSAGDAALCLVLALAGTAKLAGACPLRRAVRGPRCTLLGGLAGGWLDVGAVGSSARLARYGLRPMPMWWRLNFTSASISS